MKRTNSRFSSLFLIAVAALLLCVPRSPADRIETKSGRSLEGTIIEETDTRVVLQVPAGTVSIPREDIRSITREKTKEPSRTLARRLLSAGEYHAAVRVLRDLLEKDPDDPTLRAQIALAYARLIETHVKAHRYSQAQEIAEESSIFREESRRLAGAVDKLDAASEELRDLQAQAKALVAEGDALEALPLYEELEERDPQNASKHRRDLVEALRAQADVSFNMRRFNEAARLYGLLPRYDPALFQQVADRFIYAKLTPITEEIARRKGDLGDGWPRAARILGEILALAPNDPHALYHLGLYHESQRDYQKALKLYGRVLGRSFSYEGPVQVARVREYARSLAERLSLLVTPRQHEELFASVDREKAAIHLTTHFRIHHFNEALARHVGNVAEISLAAIRRQMFADLVTGEWPVPCDIYLYTDRQTYEDKTGMLPWTGGVYAHRTRGGGELLAHSISTFQSAPALLRNVIPHEIAHVLFTSYLGWPDKQDNWIQEGVALHSEPALRRVYFTKTIKSAGEAGTLISLDDLVAPGAEPEESNAPLFYAQSFFLVEYLMNVGEPARVFYPFARKLADQGFDVALRDQYGLDRAALAYRWHLYLKDMAASAQTAAALP